MKRLIRYTVLVAVVASLWSCAEELPSGAKLPQRQPEAPPVSARFSIDRIEYSHVSIERSEEPVRPTLNDKVTLRNFSYTAPFECVFNDHEHACERVAFTPAVGPAFELAEGGRTVKVPAPIPSGDVVLLDGGARWRYFEGEQELSPEVESRTTLTVLPRQEIEITPAFYRTHVSADYTLYLKGDEYGEERIVEGRFDGLFVAGYHTEYHYSELDSPTD